MTKASSDLSAHASAVKDWIVERGSSGNWLYEKYNSGLCHLSGYSTQQAKGGTAWGNVYYDSNAKGGLAYPFTLKAVRSAAATIVNDNGEYWGAQVGSGSTTKAPTVYACTGAKNTNSASIRINYDTWGTWK